MKYLCFGEDFKKFDNCNHFFIICGDDYDWYEGTHDFDYGCIKCGLTNRFDEYDPASVAYLRSGHRLKGFFSKDLEFSFGTYGGLELGYARARKIYTSLIEIYGEMSNERLYQLLKEESENIRLTECNMERKRKRGDK